MAGTITNAYILEGFESGRLASADANIGALIQLTSGAPAAYATNPRGAGAGGAYSLRCNPSGATAYIRWQPGSTTVTQMVWRFGLRLNTMPAGTTAVLTLSQNTHLDTVLSYNATTGNLELSCSGATAQTCAVSTGVWILVELSADVSASPNFIDWTINGVSQTRSSLVQTADFFWKLDMGFQTSLTGDMQFDDVVATTTPGDYPIGDGYIKPLLLDGTVGTHNLVSGTTMFQSSDGTNFTAITSTTDVLPATRLTANTIPWPASTFPSPRIRQSVANGSYVDLNLANTTDTPRAVAAQVMHGAATATADTGATWLIDDGGNIKEIYGNPTTPRDHSESTAFVRGCPAYNNATGLAALTPASGAWTATKLNACKVRMGASNDISPTPYWFGVLLQYEVAVVAASTTPPMSRFIYKPAVTRAATW